MMQLKRATLMMQLKRATLMMQLKRATLLMQLHLSGRLFHQYIVDMYAKIEQQRLNYIKTNQQKIRVDLYSGLADAVAKGDTNATELGMNIITPTLLGKCSNLFRTQ